MQKLAQKYVFVFLLFLFGGTNLQAQCLSVPNVFQQKLSNADKIIEGRVAQQEAFIGVDGNIYTRNKIDVYRVFKGDVGFEIDVVTEGGVYGDIMQVVTPSAQMQVGNYGVMVLRNETQRTLTSLSTAFYPVDEKTGFVSGLKEANTREACYNLIARTIGTETIALRRIPSDMLQGETTSNSRSTPSISTVYPLQVTAGTQSVLTITGSGFGQTQGSGYVSFTNADDGGQSFVVLDAGPHYLNWSDTEIQMYVPSATLYNTTVAGTGTVRVTNGSSTSVESGQQVTVDYAKGEVIYSEELNETMLVGMQQGGYVFNMNTQLHTLVGGSGMVQNAFMKWACNTGVNFTLDEGIVNLTDWAQDEVNLIGLSQPGQLPSYLLGRTITTFSSCGTTNGLQWNLIEVDILLNSNIDWWVSEQTPAANKFDLHTVILHEIGHAHLLQHNNNADSPMYFQLMEGAARRDLDQLADVDGGAYVATIGVEAQNTCGNESHQYFDFSTCDASVINGVEDEAHLSFKVYPNPFNNQLQIEGTRVGETSYSMSDVSGREVLSGKIQFETIHISTQGLSNGVYFLSLEDKLESKVFKLIKN